MHNITLRQLYDLHALNSPGMLTNPSTCPKHTHVTRHGSTLKASSKYARKNIYEIAIKAVRLTTSQRPQPSPGRRSSHPPGKDQLAARRAKQVKKDEPFDPNELARRLEQTRLQMEASKSNRLKRTSLHIGNCSEHPVPIDTFVPPLPNGENGDPKHIAENPISHHTANNHDRPNTAAPLSCDPVARVASPKFQPTSSISAFLATTSRRSHHSRPQTLVFEELHNEPQHPNPYHPGYEHVENTEVAVEDMDEAEDAVEVPFIRPPLRPKDRPDWTQRSQCGEDFPNKPALLRYKSKKNAADDSEASSPSQPSSAEQILSRTHHTIRIPPGSTRPDLKPRSLSHGDALARPPHDTTNNNDDDDDDRRASHGETRSKKKHPRWPDAIVATRQDGVTAAERHREWLEQLREQERAEAAAREREQEVANARRKARRKASFGWMVLDKVREVVH